MATTSIPLHKAATMLPDLARRARNGETILLDDGINAPLALYPTSPTPVGLLSEEQLQLARSLKTEQSYTTLKDETFADDMEAIIALRDLPSRDPWTDF